MDKKRVVIIGANSFQNKLIECAKARGYETHVFAWECGDIGEKTADFFYPISITEKDEILKICREINPVGVCSIASDLAVPTVNYVANALGLRANSNDCNSIATDKFEMRQTFMKYDLPSPKCCAFDEGMEVSELIDGMKEKGFDFPLIVKPTDRSGSRGVTQINSYEELEPALKAAVGESFRNRAVIEEFVGGTEYSIEYMSYGGKHHFLAATRKFTTGSPHFVELGHFQPARLSDDMLQRVKAVVERALDVLFITNSASHSEIKIDEAGNIKIIEIGARMGGGCIGSDLVRISTGYDFVEMVLDVACGKEPKFERVCDPQIAFIRFILSTGDLRRMEQLKADYPQAVLEITIEKEAADVIKPESSEDRAGYYIMALENQDTLDEVCEIAIEEEYRN